MHVYSTLRWQGLTLAGVSLAVSESDQRCLSWEELGTHSQNVCIGQTDRATSVGVCSSYMCNQACEHMCTHKHMHAWTNTHKETKVLDLHLERDSTLKHVFDLWTKLCEFNLMKQISAGVYNSLQMYTNLYFVGWKWLNMPFIVWKHPEPFKAIMLTKVPVLCQEESIASFWLTQLSFLCPAAMLCKQQMYL